MLVKTAREDEPRVKMAAGSPPSVGRVLTPYLTGTSFVCVCCLLSFPCASSESGSFFCVTIFFLHAFHSRIHSKVSPSPCLFQAGHTELSQQFSGIFGLYPPGPPHCRKAFCHLTAPHCRKAQPPPRRARHTAVKHGRRVAAPGALLPPVIPEPLERAL